MTSKAFPSTRMPVVNPDRTITTPWLQFFQQFVTQPGPIEAQSVGASPWTFTASEPGSLSIVGGVVSAIAITRGATTLATGLTTGLFPVSIGDEVTVTYTGLPAVNFVPA